MIQPVSTFCSSGEIARGLNVTGGKSSKKNTNPHMVMFNVCGAGIAAGGLTAVIARSHTSSWANAIVLGLFGTFLSLFFMMPQIVSSKSKLPKMPDTAITTTTHLHEDSPMMSAELKKCLKPAKKIVKFGQN